MGYPVTEVQTAQHFTGTTTITANHLLGIFVSSASSTPTLAVNDDGTLQVDTFTPVSATWYPLPGVIQSGKLVITVGGTVSATAYYGS